jgi:hypothetical protein
MPCLPNLVCRMIMMRKALLASLFVLALTLSAQVSQPEKTPAQLPPTPATDKFGGLIALPSPGGATGFFRMEKATRGDGSVKRWNFVSPLGNALYVRGVQNATYGFIEQAVMAPYGHDRGSWFNRTMKRIQSWGFDVIGDYSHLAFLPVGNTGGGPKGADVKMPFIMMLRPAGEATYHPDRCGFKQPIKDVIKGVPARYAIWDGTPMIDPFEPIMAACANAEVRQWRKNFSSGEFKDIPWIVGITTDDADFWWALKGTGDNPIKPNSYPHMGFLIAVANFAYKGSDDPKLYAKYAWSGYLQNKYKTIAALNAAWGSDYTSFGDDGGYGTGTGVLDEDGRHKEWLGDDPYMLKGAKPAVKDDLDGMLHGYVFTFELVEVRAIRAYDKNHLILGPNAFGGAGSYGPRPQVLPALAEAGVDVLYLNYDSVYPQNVKTSTAAYDKTGKPVMLWYGISANQDSGWRGQSPGNDADYKTQEKRGQVYADDQRNIFNAQAADGSYPIVGVNFWGLTDDTPGEHTNWGLISNRDNPYDGKCAVRATAAKDPWGAHCGGEAADYGDFLSAVTAANEAVVQQMIKEGTTAPKDALPARP